MGSSSGGSGAVVVCLGSGTDGTGFESSLSCLLSFFSSSFFSEKLYFCQIYSFGKGRPAAESIATAFFLCFFFIIRANSTLS